VGLYTNTARRGTVDDQIRVVTLPEDDTDFADRVKAAVASLDGNSSPTRVAIMTVLDELLPVYPGLHIRQQDGLASFEATPRTWYVYRDGVGHFGEPKAG
jgi:hypothetical protein